MLEENFNELDNDFITVWSKFITSNELDRPALMALANLGQINAQQSIMAVRSVLKFADKDELRAVVNEVAKINPRKRKLSEDFLIYKYSTKGNFNKTLFKSLISCHKTDKEPLVRERYLEIVAGSNLGHSLVGAASLRRELKKILLENNSPANRFAYAKNLYFFGSNNQRELGFYMLKDLANRDYCEATKEEMELTQAHIKRQESVEFARMLENEILDYAFNPFWI